jgi:signal transduction histidine kinase
LAGIAAWVLFWTIRRQRQQAEQTRFAFQTLTHELRTPVTDLVLSLEPLRSEFDRLSSSGQDALLRVLDDSQRLVRLTENSKRYLGVAKYRSLKPNVETIASVSQFLSEIASQVSEKVVIDPQSIDVSIEQDPYWLAICVRNLMANAVVHGKPPVIVKTELVDEVLRISVTDHGQCEFGSLSDLTAPFKKGRGSRGLGLGLSIVQDAVRILGGKLDFKREPTSFALMIPVLNKKSLKESVNS